MRSRQSKNHTSETKVVSSKIEGVSQTSFFLRGALKFTVTIIVSAALAAGGIVYFSAQLTPHKETQQRFERLMLTLASLQEKLATLENQKQESSLSASQPDQEHAIKDISTHEIFSQRIEQIEARLSNLEKKFNEYSEHTVDRSQSIEYIFQHLWALKDLQKALSTSQPFHNELTKVLNGITPARSEDESVFKTFNAIATIGAPTLQDLEDSFRTVVMPTLLTKPTGMVERWKQYIFDAISSVIIISNDSYSGSTPLSWHATVYEALKRGKLDKAMVILDGISAPISSELTNWKKGAEKRLFVDKNFFLLKAYTLEELLNPSSLETKVPASTSAPSHEKKP